MLKGVSLYKYKNVSITDRLHIGNRWLGHLGLAMYDNTARVHDPVMPRMLTCDSRAVDYPGHSPFSHCAGNPANILDPSGDSLFVAPKYRETLNNSLQDVFGAESDKFYYTQSGMLTHNGNYRDKTVEANTTDMLFHEFGHKIYQGQSQDKVLGYNNVVRKLLKLKPRRSDYEHNKFKF